MDGLGKEVWDLGKLPDRRLQIRKMVTLERNMAVDDAIRIIKYDMARALAEKIVESEDFFCSKSSEFYGEKMVEYSADCVVLTSEEYFRCRKESFKDGLRHAQGWVMGG